MNNSTLIKDKLLSLINEMDQYHWLFTRKPEIDFTRVKKWSFSDVIRFIITMEGNSLKDELYDYFDFSCNTPTNSSFNQRRSQVLPEAFEFLFHEFTSSVSYEKLYHGYRLLACDGSDLCIAHNPDDKTTYFQSTPLSRGFNQLHLNAVYDLQTRTYTDAIIQPACQENENRAMCDMIDRYSGHLKTIFIADRGYENYNIFAHAQEHGVFYLIRAKDLLSNGIVSSVREQLPKNQMTFDRSVSITLTRKQTNAVKANPKKYRIIMKATAFDYLDLHVKKFYDLQMRIVRFPISENTYESIITNLPTEDFSLEDIRALYHMRWGIETSFRELKYAIGLTHFHSKKPDYIRQEIWARLILYNFCEAITTKTVMKQKRRQRKHTYQLNYTRAIYICRHFLSIKEGDPPDIEKLISRELLPVRTGRSDPRKVKPQSAVSFLYRVA